MNVIYHHRLPFRINDPSGRIQYVINGEGVIISWSHEDLGVQVSVGLDRLVRGELPSSVLPDPPGLDPAI